MPYLRQRSLTGIPASASFKIATIWLSVMRLLIVKLLCFSLKEILRVGCIILRGSYNSIQDVWVPEINALGDKTPEAKKIWRDWKCGSEVPVSINPQVPRSEEHTSELQS